MSTAIQTTPEDAFNAALPAISPAGLIEALEDPKVLQKIAAGDLYIALGRMRREEQQGNLSVDQRLRYMSLLAKMASVGNTDPALPTAANLPQIQIVVPQFPVDYKPALPPQFARPPIDVTPALPDTRATAADG